MEGKPRIAVIVASTRKGRFGPTVAGWFAARAARYAAVEVDVVDLAEACLPPGPPDPDEQRPAEVAALGVRLAAADGFVAVTPEWNRGFPAPLKTAIDWYDAEWRAKPVAFVTYGETGGTYAAAQLQQIFTSLHAVPVAGTLGLPRYWELFAADGTWPRPGADLEPELTALLDQLLWWAHALRTARLHTPYPP